MNILPYGKQANRTAGLIRRATLTFPSNVLPKTVGAYHMKESLGQFQSLQVLKTIPADLRNGASMPFHVVVEGEPRFFARNAI